MIKYKRCLQTGVHLFAICREMSTHVPNLAVLLIHVECDAYPQRQHSSNNHILPESVCVRTLGNKALNINGKDQIALHCCDIPNQFSCFVRWFLVVMKAVFTTHWFLFCQLWIVCRFWLKRSSENEKFVQKKFCFVLFYFFAITQVNVYNLIIYFLIERINQGRKYTTKF